MPYISSCYLMKSKVVKDNNTKPSYNEENLDYDLAFSKSLRKKVYLDTLKKLYLLLCNFNNIIYRESLCTLIMNIILDI